MEWSRVLSCGVMLLLRKVYFPTHVLFIINAYAELSRTLGFPKVCLLSIRSYEARMITYARALYPSFKVKWIGKVYFPTNVLFIINTVIRGAHDNVRTCVIVIQ